MTRAMKDSGVAWIGEIPQEWEVKRMKDCFISNSRRQPNNTVLSLSYGKVIVKDMEGKKGVTPESYDSYQGVHPGDVILRLTDLQNDQKSLRVGRATEKGIITSAYLCVSSRSLNDRYSAYLLHDVGDIQKLFYGLGGGVRQSMKFADLAELLFSLPPPAEQIAIADYLDQKTALIDLRLATLAAKKAVLADLRKAIIQETVTKGLNKTAPVKDSGVAWIGEVPSHWKIKRLGYLFHEAADAGVADLPILSVSIHSGISDKELGDAEVERKVSRSEDRTLYKRIKPGDLVYNQMRAWQGAFGAAKVEGLVSPAYVVARPSKAVVPYFIEYLLRAPTAMEEIRCRSRGITDFRLRLYWEEFKNIWIALPPKDEQRSIAEFLDDKLSQIDGQLATLDEQAQILKELRKAVIHEAVTGKIDLSHYTPPPHSALAA